MTAKLKLKTLRELNSLTMPRFYTAVMRGVIRRQDIEIMHEAMPRQYAFQVAEDLSESWDELLQRDQNSPMPIQTLYQQNNAEYLIEALEKMQINVTKMSHLAIDIDCRPEFKGFDNRYIYRQETIFRKAMLLPKNEMALVFLSDIYSPDGKLMLSHEDTFLVSQVSVRNQEKIFQTTRTETFRGERFKGLAQRVVQLEGRASGMHESYYLNTDIAQRFGRLSGDLNPLHITPWGSRLLGHKKAFVQSMFTANLALQHLMSRQRLALKKFSLVFTRPAYLGQELSIANKNGILEVTNQSGELVASADYALHKTEAAEPDHTPDCQKPSNAILG